MPSHHAHRRYPLFCLCSILLALVALPANGRQATQPATAPQPSQPTLQQRLDRLCAQLEKQRETLHIPGMAIAVVKDDKVVLLRGFGERDIEQHLPVTEDTLFAIGSSTKAFTATLIGMLIDEGKMAWDDTVQTHLLEFNLHDADAAEQATLRDLLCHRTGLTRTDILWAGGKASRREILQTVAKAELYSPFREKFNYNNVMFLAAGEAAGQAAGSDWDALIAERIFKPLGMVNSSTAYEAAQKHPELSGGYMWDEELSKFKLETMRNLNGIAPAGAINSNARDMAQWVRLQLGKGEIDGKRLISAERIEETRTRQIEIAPGADYGLGWMLHEWNGKKMVEHGGNIDGFAAAVAFLPNDGVGFALLTNVTATPLQGTSNHIVFGALLGDISEDAPELDLAEVQPYLGKYHFDVLKVDCTVLIQNGRLAVDVPGQMVFELKPPDEQGKWFFDFPQPIAVSFVKDEKGDVLAMNLYQSGMTFELPREGVVMPIEVDAEEVRKYLGAYHSDKLNADVKVLIHNGRLAVDVPGQMVFDLHSPDAEGKWVCRATDTIAVKFNAAENGAIESMSVYQNGVEEVNPRDTDAAGESTLPAPDDVLALMSKAYGSENVERLGGVRMTGHLDFVHQGVEGTFTMHADGPQRYVEDFDLGQFGYIRVAVSGEGAWSDSSFHGFEELHGKYAEQLRLMHPLLPVLNLQKIFERIEVIGDEQIDGKRTFKVRMSSDEDIDCTMYVEADTGLVLKMDSTQWIKGIGPFKQTITYGDYREVHGLRLPYCTNVENQFNGRMTLEMESMDAHLDLPAEMFVLQPSVQEH